MYHQECMKVSLSQIVRFYFHVLWFIDIVVILYVLMYSYCSILAILILLCLACVTCYMKCGSSTLGYILHHLFIPGFSTSSSIASQACFNFFRLFWSGYVLSYTYCRKNTAFIKLSSNVGASRSSFARSTIIDCCTHTCVEVDQFELKCRCVMTLQAVTYGRRRL